MSTERRLVGNIEKRGEGKYRLTVSAGTDANGKRIRHRRTVEAANDREAEKLLMLYLAELEGTHYYEPERLRLAEFANKWLAEYAKNLAPKTYERYKAIFESRITPALGHLTMDKIKPLHIVEFLNSLQRDGARLDGKPGGLSEQTILHHHRVLSVVFNTAVQWGVMRENPMPRVKPPRVRKTKAAAYDEKQTAAMLEALEKEPLKYRVLIHLALVTGLRRGELMGLEWRDIDFQKNTLEVNRASQSLAGYGTFTKEPKTEESKRLVSLPLPTVQLLKEYRKEWLEEKIKIGDLWKGSERLWVTWDGRPAHAQTPTHWFPKFLKRHGLPHLNFHGLRHTSATLLISQGADVRSVSGRLGHSRTSTTMDIYVHSLRKADEAAANIMQGIVYPGANLGPQNTKTDQKAPNATNYQQDITPS